MTAETKGSKFSPALLVFLLFPVFGILAAVLMSLAAGGGTAANETLAGQSAPQLMNFAAPDFQLNDLNGAPVTLADLRGRVVFVNFWATWCAPCVKEFPEFQKFVRQQGENGAVVLALNAYDTPEKIQEFLRSLAINDVRVLLDSKGETERAYGVVNLPVTFIIDAEGKVRYMRAGTMTAADMQAYVAQVS